VFVLTARMGTNRKRSLMNWAFCIVLLFIVLDCVTNVNSLTLKWCHVPLTAFYRPVKAVLHWLDIMPCVTSSLTMSHCTMCDIASNPAMCDIMSYLTTRHIMLCVTHATSCHIIPCVTSHHILSCVASCHMWHHIMWHMLHHVMLRHVWHDITSCYVTSCDIMAYHAMCEITSHHVMCDISSHQVIRDFTSLHTFFERISNSTAILTITFKNQILLFWTICLFCCFYMLIYNYIWYSLFICFF